MKLFKKKLLSAKEIADAYKEKKHHLLAIESEGCCPGVSSRLVVVNEMVVLRQMLEQLGFDKNEVDTAF